MVVNSAYDHRECCWRYKERGHSRLECKNAPYKVYFDCGEEGILRIECIYRESWNLALAGSTDP